MKPVPHPSCTRRMAPPEAWDPQTQGECLTIEIADVVSAGMPFMESLWQPEPADLAALDNGAAIALGIQGTAHPVAYLGVTSAPADDSSVQPSSLVRTLAAAVHALRSYEHGNGSTDLAREIADAGVAALNEAGWPLERFWRVAPSPRNDGD